MEIKHLKNIHQSIPFLKDVSLGDVYKLDHTRLVDILAKIEAEKQRLQNGDSSPTLLPDGIYIRGTYNTPHMSCLIGRIVNGRVLNEDSPPEDALYLQTFTHKDEFTRSTTPDLVDLLREFIQ